MKTSLYCIAASVSTLVLVAASCSPTAPQNGFGGAGGEETSGSGGAGNQGSTKSASTGEGGLNFDGGPVGAGGMDQPCVPSPDADVDKDGFTEVMGDCNDCDPNVNPNAVEVIGNPDDEQHDEDCDDQLDEIDPPCDTGLAVDDEDPLSGARALEICKDSSSPGDWGLISAQWVMADGSPPPQQALSAFHLGHGMLSAFGANIKVRRGERMLGLSSGSARQPNDPGYKDVGGFDKQYTGNHPQGFPKESPACPGTFTGEPHDPTAIEIKLRVPSNAHGFSFDFDFYTYEWPGFVCSTYNDFFVAILSPIPPNQMDGNISFDSQGNPVSVNNAFLDVCGCWENPPNDCFAGGKTFPCPLGDAELIGTGFGFDSASDQQDHGATSWLTTKAPVEPNSEMVIRYGVYDSGDGVLDSTTIIDNFRWIAEPGTTVGTIPVPQ